MQEKNQLTDTFQSFVEIDKDGKEFINSQKSHEFFNLMLARLPLEEKAQLFANEHYGFIKFCRDKNLPIDLSGLNLSGLNFSGADLSNCFFNKANLSNANLQNTNLHTVKFNDANLTGADLSGAKVTIAKFKNANLTGAKLNNWEKTGDAVFTGAILRGAEMRNVNPGNNVNPRIHNNCGSVIFTEADLTDANFSNSNLNPNFTGAILTRTNFQNCKLFNPDFSFADMSEANISDVNFNDPTFHCTITRAINFNDKTNTVYVYLENSAGHELDEDRQLSAQANITAENLANDRQIPQPWCMPLIPHLHRGMQGSKDINLELATQNLENNFRLLLMPKPAQRDFGRNVEALATFMQVFRNAGHVFSILPQIALENIAKHIVSNRGRYPIAERILNEMIERNRPEKAGEKQEGKIRDLFLLSRQEVSLFDRIYQKKDGIGK